MYIIIAILLFGILILVHELGHYLTARIFKVAINEFSIGMGPKIFSRTSKKTEIVYSLRALPIGGYVSMAGEDEESDNPNSFDKKPVWQRMIVTVAGSVFNVLLAFIVMFVLVASTPQIGSTQISKFREGAVSPQYDLQVGDIITEINGNKVHITREIGYYISRYGIDPVDITLIRNGEELVLTDVVFAVAKDDASGYVYGQADFYVNISEKNVITVIKNGFFESCLTIRMLIDSLADLFSGAYGVEDLSGPVGVTTVIADAAKTDAYQLFYIFVFIAMNLGVMNLLPFPALDGGRLIVLFIELIIRRPVNKKVEGYINMAGMLVLFAFLAFITVKDIGMIIQKAAGK
jgi:regulator of sigma E protease